MYRVFAYTALNFITLFSSIVYRISYLHAPELQQGYMDDRTTSSVNYLKAHAAALPQQVVTAGFDGFIDSIIRVVKNKTTDNSTEYFNTILEFGNYITQKSGGSFSVEFEESVTKIGGNMPITANALACSGITVNCVGAFGYPHINPLFNTLPAFCRLYSFSDPGTAVAYEFTDGKMMLAQMKSLNSLGWDVLKERIGLNELVRLVESGTIFCLFNWSEIDASTGIWQGLLEEVMPACTQWPHTIFVDLSDCSKRSDAAILEMLSLLKAFAAYTKITLSLNKNEFQRICIILPGCNEKAAFSENGLALYQQLGIDVLLLHHARQAIAYAGGEEYKADSFFISNPVISTGAGDNFNAGYIAALLTHADMHTRLACANAAAALYISSGTSADMDTIIRFLADQ